ncbi:MAG: thioredoxin domain-containing protein, partial [Chloroflexota bacterium]
MPNQLTNQNSPYLVQHANNPVDWYPWGPEALEKARLEDKPIFLSIGYAACHWCHVMAHESFEDPEIAAILRSGYISIKVDREERPDLDSIYMAAVVALTGQGGWPMTVFLTPDLEPFYGGTYFPPERRHGLPAFKELLLYLSEAWQKRRVEITRSAQQISLHLQQRSDQDEPSGSFTTEMMESALTSLLANYDWKHGGWGTAPRFPQPMTIEFLLRRHHAGHPEALKPAIHALHAMSRGGMYDVIAGGFSRYSTDNNWLVPHFEKMLYDNAQLARVYLHAWQVSRQPFFRQVVEETLGFVMREMLSPQGGFYSSLDADSEGEEGKFYAWSLDELRSTLAESSPFFESAYGIHAGGNWEGKIVLQRAVDDTTLASQFGLTPDQVAKKLADCHARLLSFRETRIRPGTDDKVLTAWNGLMLSAFAEAGRVFSNADYLQIASRNADFLLTSLQVEGKLRRTWRLGQSGTEVFLEDYAALILGLLELYQSDFNQRWFTEACRLTEEMLARFSDPVGGFFDTARDAEKLLTRPKDLQDNATPSGNALAAEALLRLAALTERADWRQTAETALNLVADMAPRYPTSFGRWLSAADLSLGKVDQVAILGDPADERTQALLNVVRNIYHPAMVVAASSFPPPDG